MANNESLLERGRRREQEDKWADVRLDTIRQAEEALRAILVHQGCVKGDFMIGQIGMEKLPPNTSARTDALLIAYAILRSMPVM